MAKFKDFGNFKILRKTEELPRQFKYGIKGEILKMIRIKKEEALALNKMGFKFANSKTGSEGVLHKTTGHHTSYYLTESSKALDALIKYRNDY